MNEKTVAEVLVDLALLDKNPRPEQVRKTLQLFAKLLRRNDLPKTGREWLAERLEAIADGADPGKVMLPRKRKEKAVSPVKVLALVEQERDRRGAGYGDGEEVHARVAQQLPPKAYGEPMGAGTIAKLASRGRRQLREGFAHALSQGYPREELISDVAEKLRIEKGLAEKLLEG